jgi:energy-converting hydrogenase Eha subunit G
VTTPAPSGADWKKLLAVFRQASSLASMASLFLSGVIFSFMTLSVGGPFAMGLAMYTGNTEPREPHAGYPWGIAGVSLAVWIFGLLLEYRLGKKWLGIVLSHAGAVAFVFVLMLHLYRLWKST